MIKGRRLTLGRSLPELPIVLYPAAIVMLLLAHVWAVAGVSAFVAARAMIVTGAAATVVLVATRVILRDRHAGGVVALLLILGVAVGGRSVTWLVVTPAIAFVALERRARRPSIEWRRVGRVLSAMTAILGLSVLLETIVLGRAVDLATTIQRAVSDRPGPATPATGAAPDVFIMVLDGYARHDVLAERFSLDDRPFLDGLRGRGFVVSDGSHSNYPWTNASLASFLNHRQLVGIPGFESLIANPSAVEGPVVRRAISDAAVIGEFRAVGYRSIAIASGFAQADLRYADQFVDTGELNEFEIAVVHQSVAVPLLTALDPDVFSRNHRHRIEDVFETVASIAATRSDRPRFVFAHVPSPHAPWVHEANGRPRVGSNLATWFQASPEGLGLGRQEVAEAFAAQSTHLGTLALAAVDRILAGEHRDVVVIVMSDHGAGLDVGWEDREVQLRNLFAAHTPGMSGLFPADVTLVNVLPTLFRAYLGVDLPTSDETLYTAGPRGPYDLVPVEPSVVD